MSSNEYEIHQCIGKGNFGDVYKATQKSSSSVVAIKVINLDESEEDISVLISEIHFLSKLRSNYITRYYETFISDMSMWIVMEYCGGGSCADLLKCHKKLNEETTAFIIRDVLRGLNYLHEENNLHRDIKSANILLTSAGEIKLADFGVSGEITMTQLKRNTFVGTPFWMAPEVIVRQKTGYNEKADIWSTGITTIELVTGSPPLSQYDPMKILFEIPKKRPPLLTGLDFSENIKDFVRYCLIKDPKKRPSSSTLLHHKFVKNIKRNVNILRLIEEKDEWFSKHQKYAKKPKYPLKPDVEKNDDMNSLIKWEFNTRNSFNTRIFEMEQTLLENSPNVIPSVRISSADQNISVSPLKSPVSQAKSPSFSIAPTSPLSPLTPGPVTSSSSERPPQSSPKAAPLSQEQSPVDAVHRKVRPVNFLDDVLLYCLEGLYNRARAPSTKATVRKLMQNFMEYEAEQPGLTQAFIEEVLILKNVGISSISR
ncbi:Piso0_005674 [Millerozyma farinosa CBS 7064]|uniref:non-specific serine/threonine protein kinase n=1 Tax=Pichia sorbitophila (strain ATCC MYA-4447 / BCRC 22081 / CBS 7064 / NBRC 10061 / NRRL Y-12695) TaxID=559304 RepID=G8Y2L9_PICSO|nr:Piso0_005674 [Millerozyma farinosa CBS 7064]